MDLRPQTGYNPILTVTSLVMMTLLAASLTEGMTSGGNPGAVAVSVLSLVKVRLRHVNCGTHRAPPTAGVRGQRFREGRFSGAKRAVFISLERSLTTSGEARSTVPAKAMPASTIIVGLVSRGTSVGGSAP